jgi:hypothetical protein
VIPAIWLKVAADTPKPIVVTVKLDADEIARKMLGLLPTADWREHVRGMFK